LATVAAVGGIVNGNNGSEMVVVVVLFCFGLPGTQGCSVTVGTRSFAVVGFIKQPHMHVVCCVCRQRWRALELTGMRAQDDMLPNICIPKTKE
jgi:hypothetical protein